MTAGRRTFALVRAVRPHQWLKNLFFVGAPLVFAQRMDDATALTRTAIAVLCFCLLASAVYLLNDILDVEKDRVHPHKRFRPIASGALSIPTARVAALVLASAALGVGYWLNARFAAVEAAYLSLNVAYSFGLKRVAFVDVACLALSFLLRVVGGAFAIPVPISGWLLACTTLLSALLGFGKRAHELRTAGDRGASQRDALKAYDPAVLKVLLYLLAVCTTAAYAAYTQAPHALRMFHTRSLILTVPFVAFGIFRFLWLVHRKSDDESPTDSMLRDRLFLLNLLLYAASIVGIIYYR
jgi:4-hydroxybenzoate polyprenyltransferase